MGYWERGAAWGGRGLPASAMRWALQDGPPPRHASAHPRPWLDFSLPPPPTNPTHARFFPQCMMKAIAVCKPGTRYRDLGDIITQHAHRNGFSVVKTYCGHGIGDLFHCAPNVPHYAQNKARGVMKEGEVFTVEPMICAGTYRDKTWPDGWCDDGVGGGRGGMAALCCSFLRVS